MRSKFTAAPAELQNMQRGRLTPRRATGARARPSLLAALIRARALTGISPQPPPVFIIYWDDATAATAPVCSPHTIVERREREVTTFLSGASLRFWSKLIIRWSRPSQCEDMRLWADGAVELFLQRDKCLQSLTGYLQEALERNWMGLCSKLIQRYVMLMKPGHKYLLGTVIDEELLSL
ncbi:hypothetical protein F2P79_010043 [Pimephales promelas]|nr:hypothetical protein F2P79_010043 [Pimephales promelas]